MKILAGFATLSPVVSFASVKKRHPILQKVTFENKSKNYPNVAAFLTDWQNFSAGQNFNANLLMPTHRDGVLLEERVLLNGHTMETRRIWSSEAHYQAWLLSDKRKELGSFLSNQSIFHLSLEEIKSTKFSI